MRKTALFLLTGIILGMALPVGAVHPVAGTPFKFKHQGARVFDIGDSYIQLYDDMQLRFGTGNDIQMYYDSGTESFQLTGTTLEWTLGSLAYAGPVTFSLMTDGTYSPKVQLDMNSVTHGMTDLFPTNCFGSVQAASTTVGGAAYSGISEGSGISPVYLAGIFSETDPADTLPCVMIDASKRNGTSNAAIASSEIATRITNYASELLTVYGSGNAHLVGSLDIDTLTTDGVMRCVSGELTSEATLALTRGGLGADVSAYNGLVKISGGSASAVTDNSSNWNDAYSKRVDTWTVPLSLSSNVASIANAAADGSTKGAASFSSADFTSSSGNISLADSVVKAIDASTGTATGSTHEITIVGGGINTTTATGYTLTVTGTEVDSVAGAVNGAIASNGSSVFSQASLDSLSDVTIASAATNEIIGYSGTAWVDTATSALSASTPLSVSNSPRIIGASAAALSIADAVADDSTKGAACFEADDFDSASGKIDLADSVLKQVITTTGTATVASHGITIEGAGIAVTSASGDTVTITATEVDGSVSNEIQNLWATISSQSGTTTASSSTDTLTINGAGIAATAISGDTLTITATEVDGSVSNELQNLFSTFTAPSGGPIVADSQTDTIGFEQAGIITITASAGSDTIEISATEAQTLAAVTALGATTSSNIELYANASFGRNGATGAQEGIVTLRDGGNPGTMATLNYTKWADLEAVSGLVACNGLGDYSAVTNNSTNWDTAYSTRILTVEADATNAIPASNKFGIKGAGICTTSGSGANITITATEVDGSISNELQNLFQTISCPSGTSPVAESQTDTLGLEAAGIVTITGNEATDTVEISAVEAQDLAAVTAIGATTATALTLNGNVTMGSATVDCETFTMIKGEQTSDPQVSLALSDDGNGDATLNSDTGALVLQGYDGVGVVSGAFVTNKISGDFGVLAGNSEAETYIDTYSNTTSECSQLVLRKSANDTIGSKTQTADGETLAKILIHGVDDAVGFGEGFAITATQDGSVSTFVPTTVKFESYAGTGPNYAQFVLPTGGGVQMGNATYDCGMFTMIKGAQASDPTATISLSADGVGLLTIATTNGSNGDIALTPSGGNLSITGVTDGAVNDAVTNAATTLATWTHTTSGTPAQFIGVGQNFVVETSAANNEILGKIEVVGTTVEAEKECGDIIFSTMRDGAAAAERFRIHENGASFGKAAATAQAFGFGIGDVAGAINPGVSWWAGMLVGNDASYSSYVDIYTNSGATTAIKQARVEGDGGIFLYNLGGATGKTAVEWDSSSKELVYDTSSIQFKENVRDDPDTSWIYDLRPRLYDRKDKSRKDEIGLIAEEVAEVRPGLECRDENGEILSYSKHELLVPMLAEIQKLRKLVDKLEKRVEELEAAR